MGRRRAALLPRITSYNVCYTKLLRIILQETAGGRVLYCREGVRPEALLEVRRLVGGPFRVETLSQEAFDSRLMESYQRDSSAARQMMEDIGNEMDFFTLAEELPDSEDLLDTDDDAPIIRLINAMLSEA